MKLAGDVKTTRESVVYNTERAYLRVLCAEIFIHYIETEDFISGHSIRSPATEPEDV